MGKASMEGYPTDLRDEEWEVMERIWGTPEKLGRPARFKRRAVLGAIFYMVRTGGSWRLLPNDLPPWRIVYYYFAKWREQGLFEKLHAALREAAREKSGKKKPQRLRYWIAKACARLAEEEFAVMMRERRSWDENVICWWTPMV